MWASLLSCEAARTSRRCTSPLALLLSSRMTQFWDTILPSRMTQFWDTQYFWIIKRIKQINMIMTESLVLKANEMIQWWCNNQFYPLIRKWFNLRKTQSFGKTKWSLEVHQFQQVSYLLYLEYSCLQFLIQPSKYSLNDYCIPSPAKVNEYRK